ncbi:MliC family protein [Paludibacterium paludis]|uniref:C-type lysozyme inhibitor domain-containing protein n=1 Tax=Paludibacterium paludis TaxID=1225769 RepID=A0A918P3F6_9NEIS|nr:MliC family protein [Paludibacterium paludis]GGY16683.1 hypothetical protein GCM10011289_20020 [Paludibacterium paludis]
MISRYVVAAPLLAALALPVLAEDAPSAPPAKYPLTVRYACAGGVSLTATYPDPDRARRPPVKLAWKGRTWLLKEGMSASGVRYVSRSLVWWTKGDSGFLTTRGGRMLARDCTAAAAD